jgi:AcrR family transcriptional regulator
MNTPRRYSMERRSANAEATKARVREAANKLYEERPEDFTLKAVAERAGTSVQTVLRLFGSKASLVASLLQASRAQISRRVPVSEDIVAAIRARYGEYEMSSDVGGGQLANDPTRAKQLEAGRQSHREWVEKIFAGQIGAQASMADQARFFGFIVATDISVWTLLRSDFGLYRRAAEAVVIGIVTALMQER